MAKKEREDEYDCDAILYKRRFVQLKMKNRRSYNVLRFIENTESE